jgi:hypothetical protein
MKDMEREVVKILRAQYGVVARGQLLRVGVTGRQIEWRCATGEWVAAHRGVYCSVAFPVSFEQRLMAALLAAGPDAVASHASAAWLWQLRRDPPDRPSLTVPSARHPRLAGADIFRLNDLDHLRVSRWRNFDCTDPLRTLVDLAAVAPREDLVRAVDKALSEGLVTVKGLEAEVARRAARGRRGVSELRSLLSERGLTGEPEPSALEAATVALLARWRIPILGREVRAGDGGRYRLEFSLPPPVMLEVDGFAYHWSPEAKAYDEERRNHLRLQGIFLLVYTWRDIFFDGRRVGRETLAAIDRFAGEAPPG